MYRAANILAMEIQFEKMLGMASSQRSVVGTEHNHWNVCVLHLYERLHKFAEQEHQQGVGQTSSTISYSSGMF